MINADHSIEWLVQKKNQEKLLFTPGPASLLSENLTGLRPCFGRGDIDYNQVEEQVLESLKAMTGHRYIARMQGSASLALEVSALNFLYGRVLIISTGYYSDRLKWLAESAHRRVCVINEVASVNWHEMDNVIGHFDWLVACSTETSSGLKLSITLLSSIAKRLGARLMLDATASIGLEDDHDLADVIGYSSCKGLFGLTGASFIAFNDFPIQEVDSFYLNLSTHLEKRMTGPYHALASLVDVLPNHDDFKFAVEENKTRFIRKMSNWLTVSAEYQPKICTHVNCNITSKDPRAVLYFSRGGMGGSIVCHLGEIHLKRQAKGDIQDVLEIAEIGS